MEEKVNRYKSQIPYSHFIDIWRGVHRNNPNYSHYYNTQNDVVKITNTKVLGEAIYVHNENLPQLTLVSCEIDYLIISSSNVKGVILQDTIISQKIIVQQNSRIHEIGIAEGSNVNGIQIDSSELYFLSSNNSKINQISNINGSKIEHLTITDSQIKYLSSGQKSIFVKIHITRSNIEHISFVNSYISSLLVWQKSKIDLLQLADKMIIGDINIGSQNEIGNLYMNGSNIYDLKLSNSSFESLHFFGVKIFKVKLENLIKLNNLNCTGSCYFEYFTISTQKLSSAIFKQTTFYILDIIDCQLSKDSFLSISNSQLNKLKISNSLFGGTFMLNAVSPVDELKRFIEYPQGPFTTEFKEFEFRTDNDKSLLRITESDLGKAQFIGCDFRKFKSFEFKNSKILEVFVAGTDLPVGGFISYPFDAEDKNTYLPSEQNLDDESTIATYLKSISNIILEQQRLALSQFKKIYENRGDTVRATQALAEEMEVYRLQLKNKPVQFHWPISYKVWTWHHAITKNKQWWNNRSERANLWLNMFSSYYGNNWIKAASWTLVFNSGFFLLYCLSIGYRPGWDIGKFFTLAAYSFEFLNPLRKADFLKHKLPGECEGLSVFIDYFSRIIIAYFVYQTIAAFRKFGKKSG